MVDVFLPYMSLSALRKADICRVSFKKEVKISFSTVRREMEKFTSRESVEG